MYSINYHLMNRRSLLTKDHSTRKSQNFISISSVKLIKSWLSWTRDYPLNFAFQQSSLSSAATLDLRFQSLGNQPLDGLASDLGGTAAIGSAADADELLLSCASAFSIKDRGLLRASILMVVFGLIVD